MNEAKWNDVGTRFMSGSLEPANGFAAWDALAMREAAQIASTLPASASTIIEVGCGVGRLTPHLADLFDDVHATDTAEAMRRATRWRCKRHPNVTVTPPDPDASADAIVVWGTLYDQDWTTICANAHIAGLCDQGDMVLIQTNRRDIRYHWEDRTIAADTEWIMVAA